MPELTELMERQPEESVTETTTAQPPSMLRRGGTGESERGGREGRGQPQVQGLPDGCSEAAAHGNKGFAFFPL